MKTSKKKKEEENNVDSSMKIDRFRSFMRQDICHESVAWLGKISAKGRNESVAWLGKTSVKGRNESVA